MREQRAIPPGRVEFFSVGGEVGVWGVESPGRLDTPWFGDILAKSPPHTQNGLEVPSKGCLDPHTTPLSPCPTSL